MRPVVGLQFANEYSWEADYVGLYALALAGYDIERAPDFWRRMSTLDPDSIVFARSHPTTPERFLGLEQTAGEIQQKLTAGLPLTPEIKKAELQSGEGDERLPAATPEHRSKGFSQQEK